MAQPVDFVGLNTFIYDVGGWDIAVEPRDIKRGAATTYGFLLFQNLLGAPEGIGFGAGPITDTYKNFLFPLELPNAASYFPALMIHRNGPYNWPTWKQIRIGDNPLIRKQRLHNVITVVEQPGAQIVVSKKTDGIEPIPVFRQAQTIINRYGDIKVFRESPITNKYHPLSLNLGKIINSFSGQRGSNTVIRRFNLKLSLGNETEHFINKELNEMAGTSVGEINQNYSIIKSYYLDGALDKVESPIDSFEFLGYKEKIYPKEINTYRPYARTREQFVFPWNSIRTTRTELEVRNSFNPIDPSPIPSQSQWPLDADQDWLTRDPPLYTAFPTVWTKQRVGGRTQNNSLGGNGILLSSYTTFRQINSLYYTGAEILVRPTASCIYSRRTMLTMTSSVVAPYGMPIPSTASTGQIEIQSSSLGEGSAAWEAGVHAGYYSGSQFVLNPKTPFYNSYNQYAEETRLRGQGYTIVPEFRMSSHVERFSDSPELNSNLDIFELTGTSLGNSAQADFYKTNIKLSSS